MQQPTSPPLLTTPAMADERPERDQEDQAGTPRNSEAERAAPPDEVDDVAGDVDARRLEITPDRAPRPGS